MRRVTFSRNFTLSLSRTCQCYCKYCAFATHQAHVHPPEEVESQLDQALRRNTKELLVLTGERPEVNPVVAQRLADWGHEDFTSYVVWACERALERGMLPHTNLGVLSKEDLARLREVTASQGLMLESISERLMDTVHAGSPTKHPAQRLATIEETAGAALSGDAAVIDARQRERFEGEPDEVDPQAGHIPGALSVPCRENVGADGRLLPAPELRARFDFGPTTEVISYCGSGVTACLNLLAMEQAGLRPGRLFPGSWSQWSRDPARPVQTGASPPS